jgi:hypothetical protein
MEDAGNAEDIALIDRRTPELLAMYRGFSEKLSALFETEAEDKRPLIDESVLAEAYASIEECAGMMDYDTTEMVLDSLKAYRLPPEDAERMDGIRAALVELDWERVAAMGKR